MNRKGKQLSIGNFYYKYNTLFIALEKVTSKYMNTHGSISFHGIDKLLKQLYIYPNKCRIKY